MNIKVELTVEEANLILRVLGKHPFEEVVALINKIKAQGDSQVAEAEKTADETPPAA